MGANVFNFADVVTSAFEEAARDMKRVNIVVAGRSGVGKSTLVNAVFQGNIAETGQGRPVTQTTTEYTKGDLKLAILDTRGLEMNCFRETLSDLEKLVAGRRAEADIERQLHVAWVCISEESRRVEEGESSVAELFDRYNVPVVAVITKIRNDNGFSNHVRELLPRARNVARVRALAEVDEEGNRLGLKGLPELMDVTSELVPDAQRKAFAAVQKVNLGLKKAHAHKRVAMAATAAAATGAVPIPFSDALVLIPIEIGMLAGISAAFGLLVNQAFLSTLTSSAFVALAGTVGGRAIVTGLLKLIPGAGSLVGGTIAAATAAALTTTFGELYIGVLAKLFESRAGEPPSAEDVAAAFRDAVRSKTGH